MDIKEILAGAIKKAALTAIEKGTVKGGELPEVLLEVPPQNRRKRNSVILPATLPCSLPEA